MKTTGPVTVHIDFEPFVNQMQAFVHGLMGVQRALRKTVLKNLSPQERVKYRRCRASLRRSYRSKPKTTKHGRQYRTR